MSYTRQSAPRDTDTQQTANKVVSPKFIDQRSSTQTQLKQQDMMQAKAIAQRASLEEEEPLQGKFVAQREGLEEEEPLQGKFVAQLAGMEEEEPLQGKFEPLQRASLEEEQPAQTKPNNTGLPDNLKSGIENLSGYAMDDVKVHYNSSKPSQLQAHAYAQGTDIHIAPGQEQHLPHEAWHVVQQKQGRVQPTMQMQGQGVNDDVGLEHEADVMGAKAIQRAAELPQGVAKSSSLAKGSIQLHADVYSKEAYANPEKYLSEKFKDTNLQEDAGSGGILDKPMQNLVLLLARPIPRQAFIEQLTEAAQSQADYDSIRELGWVSDRETSYQWVLKNTLRISNLAPGALIYHHEAEKDTEEVHTFHRDHGYVVLTDKTLADCGVNSSIERTARLKLANGPGNKGWIRGHYGVTNKKHRFIEHIHVDKDKPEDQRFEIYNADNKSAGETAEAFNLNNRAGLSEANDGRAIKAAEHEEGEAKRVAWENYNSTLEPESD